ncbi:MAG: carboxypeptidase regulatory-like domain-containing protein [Planctomycetales bacterium]|nr:carboxypeptidase regulatory-like domain-containing protein [Planctomycetales bacterium]
MASDCILRVVLSACALALASRASTSAANATEIVVLSPETFDSYAPNGKETDAIYGDFVLRNDRITAVVAQPGNRRHANLKIKDVGGSLIDLTSSTESNDQFGALYPLTGWTLALDRIVVDGQMIDAAELAKPIAGKRIELVFHGRPPSPTDADAAMPDASASVLYVLNDGDEALTIDTTITNSGEVPLSTRALEGDALLLDGEFEFGVDDDLRLAWGADRFWRQAYGVLPADATPRLPARSIQRGRPFVRYANRSDAELAPGASSTRRRHVFPAADLLGVKAIAARLRGQTAFPATIRAIDPAGPVVDATVTVRKVGASDDFGFARTDEQGAVACELPPGAYDVTVEHQARGKQTVRLDVGDLVAAEATAELSAAGYVVGEIVDGEGQAIACKIDFAPADGGAPPNFGPDSAIFGVRNLVYTPNGKFRVAVRPGQYELLAGHGPEHDAATAACTVKPGEETTVNLALPRSVDTTGWVSADYHSHSSPSGDNTSSQRGRVLNLLAEHLEFAPCTEHQRITTYDEHLAALDAVGRLASCAGMELTGSPLPLNHQNAFPLVHHEHAQDGGGPEIDVDPVTQIRRLAMWDDGSDKLVQSNHPNIPQMLGDRDLNRVADEGFAAMFGVMDVIEVHPPQGIFSVPESLPLQARQRGNTIFHWLQLLNQGRRVPGVVNTDAHWNFHGSGWLRNYVKCATDDPAKIDVMDMVHESEQGHIVMSNGPFLEATARTAAAETPALPGDDLAAPDGKVSLSIRVQCPNWLDVNRVQVFVNGRPDPALNWTRPTHRAKFHDGVVKFDETVDVELAADAHLIVAAIGEGLNLGRVYGPDQGQSPPTAVANPIYVDVDGNGFQPNGDQLGVPLPVLDPVPTPRREAHDHH